MSTTQAAAVEGRFRALAENATSAIILIDEESTIFFANRAAEELFGYPADELVGKPLTMLMPEALRQRHRDAVERYLRTGERRVPWTGIELPGLTRDGREIPVEIAFGEYEENGRHYFSGIITDLRPRKAASEQVEKRLSFLSRASAALSQSLVQEDTLRTIAEMAVPELGDWAMIDLVVDGGEVKRVAVQHENPDRVALLQRIAERYPPRRDMKHGAMRVIRTGQTECVEHVTDRVTEETAVNEEHAALLKQLGIRSLVVVPLKAHGRTLGAITLAYSESGRTYTEADRALLEELGNRAGMAIHNSQVVRQLEEAREQLEKQAEELTRQKDELRAATRRLNLFLEQTPLAAIDCDREKKIISWNPAANRIFGYDADEAIGRPIEFLVAPGDRAKFNATFSAMLSQEIPAERPRFEHRTKAGRIIHCEWYSTPLVEEAGEVIGVGSLVEDVSDRQQAEAQSQRQMEQLNALRSIDLAITASMDLRVTLVVLLDQAVSQLGVDAADILLLSPFTQRLEFAAGRGFRTTGIQSTELLLGECSAGRAALDRRTVGVTNLRTSSQFTRKDLLAGEELVSHYATPLISKGRVTGVLEVFSRDVIHADAEWLGFLEALAGQAAIAVESTQLFEDLQRSNLELVLAYDTTLEGWARALDLRDNVTEGHSRRVTEMTVRLARAFGLDDTELANVRRGALLHDIGKMGIPDEILRKEGPLTEEEWAIMRKHPVYAFELLSSIEFLRPAIDIPYAHHEHWDGTGYPRGLKGDEIPLAARLFAVVDIWDALRSDRPYNQAWPEERVREHIRSLAGTQLDPEVVETFLGMEW